MQILGMPINFEIVKVRIVKVSCSKFYLVSKVSKAESLIIKVVPPRVFKPAPRP